MTQPYVGEIRLFGGNFAPAGWAFCNGQLLSIADNDALFALIGTTYGGDGQNTFALPDLQGRLPFHMGTGTSGTQMVIGQKAGEEQVALTTQQIPQHAHTVQASSAAGSSTSPAGNVWASFGDSAYSSAVPNAQMDPTVIGQTGGSQPHDNMPPFLALSFIISLFGIFPSRS
jgi:microcystin-dependent protein